MFEEQDFVNINKTEVYVSLSSIAPAMGLQFFM